MPRLPAQWRRIVQIRAPVISALAASLPAPLLRPAVHAKGVEVTLNPSSDFQGLQCHAVGGSARAPLRCKVGE
ncbi:hypothetical protein BDP81DRAFT_169113 [Colletotrichum phormii]|uniref:Uncharacterized protein n=1 Tax=Colletotrichum phormii TaxID=359342 RepID=A0AAI9ZCI2_9PEZI|nr:uncharacterized protein BDP81DRAFT_169113 [Colletotrichum phormii]KAK1621911.1 hypothetical protein BDP81DRAFT_169113 [Colletotrichum phormii]